MSGDRPFFGSDPRPVDFMDPDDPRPVDFLDPDDPRPVDFLDPDDPRPVDFLDPDDPRPVDFLDPDDPRPVDFMDPDDPRPVDFLDPDDPRPVDFLDPDDPRPVDFLDPDDPAVRHALQLLRRRCTVRGGGRRRSRSRPRRRRFPLQHSGRIIVRLAADLDLPSVDGLADLRAVARRLDLAGLRRVLKRYGVTARATRRLVDVQFREAELAPRRAPEDGRRAQDDVQAGPVQEPYEPAEPPSPRVRLSTWELERVAAASELAPLHNLAAYWGIDVRNLPRSLEPEPGERRLNGWVPHHRQTVRAMLRELNGLSEVDLAYRELAVSDPGPLSGDAYALVQAYLERAPIGIDASWVWALGVPVDAGPRFVDLEQGWLAQEDLGFDPELRLVVGSNRHGEGTYRGHHGTAVLGQVVGTARNRLGIRGIAAGPRVVLLASHYDRATGMGGNVANAIRQAIGWLDTGDVLLLEVQRSYLPTEVDPLDRDAIRLAVSRGIIVVEAAGNGNASLDRYVDEEGGRILSRRHPDYRESGALMVAAARSSPPHDRLSGRVGVGSNYGTRIDCFAHGDRIVTSGYGDLNGYLESGEPDPRTAYSASFGGTSGAAPIIAGAALVVQGAHRALSGSILSPWEMRRLLSDPATGTRQGRRVRGRIGVMPDLERILRRRLGLAAEPFLRDHPQDSGRVPVGRRTARCPDIVVSEGTATPDRFDDSYPGPGELGNREYSVFVRVRNRGRQPVAKLEVKLYCGPVASLVTPDMWREIDAAGGVGLSPAADGTPQSVADLPVWSEPIRWNPGRPDAELTGFEADAARYCFIAIVRDAREEPVVEPPSEWPFFDWRRYLAFLRRHNNVACRNLHVVSGAAGASLPFLITGAPDRERLFDLEVLSTLPADSRLALATHSALASALRRYRRWEARQESADPPRVRLTLPRQGRLRVAGVRLGAGARFPCRFELQGGAAEGHSLALRQLYRGREVGRITWLFRDPE